MTSARQKCADSRRSIFCKCPPQAHLLGCMYTLYARNAAELAAGQESLKILCSSALDLLQELAANML